MATGLNFGKFNSVLEFMNVFNTEKKCIRYLEKELWADGVVSPYDTTSKVYRRGDGNYRCKNTGKNFNVRVGTIFEGTKLPLRKWFMAIYYLTCHSKGMSALQLSKELDVTYKTAWFLCHRIRAAYSQSIPKKLYGEVELDETFVGGKNKNRHKNKKVPKSQGRCHKDKTPVLGMIERGGNIICKVVETTSAKHLTPHILRAIHLKKSTLMIDEWCGYDRVKRWYSFKQVDHGKGIYGIGDAYTNTIEGFWSNYCKRPIHSTYNSVSRKHLQRYFDEFCFRYNYRKVSLEQRFMSVIRYAHKRLTFKELVNGIQKKTQQQANAA